MHGLLNMASEFDLISRYFSPPAPNGFVGVGDDCAVLPLTPDKQWVTSTDLLIQDQHFAAGADPWKLGHKALAVNVSDLAAMGATPQACLLGLALPSIDEAWVQAFRDGFLHYAHTTGCALIGGDTTRSAAGIHISVTVLGLVNAGRALRRSAAQLSDDVWLTGQLGAAHLAWQLSTGRWAAHRASLSAHWADIQAALHTPLPPWQLAPALAQWAHAAIDISDGLAQDLGHILTNSACGASVYVDALPAHPALAGLPVEIKHEALLSGGEVYQLCFTAPPAHRARINALGEQYQTRITRVGEITAADGLRILDGSGQPVHVPRGGFDHFAEPQP